MSKTRTVFHPTIKGVSYEVEDSDKWKAAGWRLTDPAKTTTTTKQADSDAKSD